MVKVTIQETKSKKVISPFTGGGSFELALLNTGVIEHLHINDVDVGVFSLWLSIKQDPKPLIDRIQHMTPTHNEYFALRTLLEEANASRKIEIDVTELAWAALVVNRL